MFRVPFDRNRYSVPWTLASQQVIVRADDDFVTVCLETKPIAQHRRSARSFRYRTRKHG